MTLEGYGEAQGGRKGRQNGRRDLDRTGSASGPRGRKGGLSDLVAMGLPISRSTRPSDIPD